MARGELGAKATKPRACLRVGVTGHRTGPKLPPTVEPQVRATVQDLFAGIRREFERTAGAAAWAFDAEPPQLVVVSALAEGADRIVAEAGLAAGATLDVVLPSSQAVYEQDFGTDASKAHFRDLLGKARSVFALDDPEEGPLGGKRGYEAAGLIMLAHTDLLIAIWDEGEAAGIGGTAHIVEQAVTEGAPILLINPSAPTQPKLLWTGDMDLPPAKIRVEDLPTSDALEGLPSAVRALVAPPLDAQTRAGLEIFYGEPPGPAHGWPMYSGLLALLGVRQLRRTDFRPRDEHRHSAEDWRKLFPGEGDPLTDAVCRQLLPAITVPDRLAIRYAELYRSAFVFNFLASAVVVLFALFGLATELPWMGEMGATGKLGFKAVLVAGEIMLLSAIVLIWRRGRHRGWHRRWLDYRRTAEWLRHLRVLTLVGARSPIQRPRRTAGAATEAGRGQRLVDDDWVAWYVRALSKALPPPGRSVDSRYVEAVRAAMLDAELDAQIEYHHQNSWRMQRAAHRLHRAGLILFATPMMVGAVYLLAFGWYLVSGGHSELAHSIRFYVTALTASLPAFGAALNAIRVQGDFETVAQRSEAAAARLATIRAAMKDDPCEFSRLSDRIQRAVAVMGAEHSEWRTLFGTRPLSLPA